MSIIVKRATKGLALTSGEIDANVNNLNNDKVEINNPTFKAAPSLVNNLIPLTGTVLPAIYPSLNLDFANSKQLDPRITFSRNTVATYINKYGLLVSAASNVPRFDYDPITKKPLGLLIEELRTNSLVNSTIDGVNLATQDITTNAVARTLSFYGTGSVTLSGRVNILTKTEDFSDVAWSRVGTAPTITINSTASPIGTLTANKLVFSASGTGNRINQGYGINSIHKISVWLKGEVGGENINIWDGWATTVGYTLTTSWQLYSITPPSLNASAGLYLYATNGTPTIYAWGADVRPTNTTNFLPAYQRVNTASDFTPATATITGLGAYPTRTTYTYTPTAGTLTLTVSGTVQYANDEVGAFATSYIPTAGTEKSRAADQASMSGVNFSSWYNQSEGSLYVEGDKSPNPSAAVFPRFAGLYGAAFENYSLGLGQWNANQVALFAITDAVQANMGISVPFLTFNSNVKIASSFKVNNFLLSGNGVVSSPDTLGILPIINRLEIGSGTNGSINGHIKKLTYYPKALTAVELQGLTS